MLTRGIRDIFSLYIARIEAKSPKLRGRQQLPGTYSIYFSSEIPFSSPNNSYSSGDLWFQGQSVASAYRERSGKGNKSNMFPYYNGVQIYYRMAENWIPVEKENLERKDSSIPHPLSRSARLNLEHLSWREKSSISSTNSRNRIKNEQSDTNGIFLSHKYIYVN
jgi:hypothetical protein